MEDFTAVLKQTKLFAGIGDAEIGAMLSCLGAVEKRYEKDEYVFRQGDRINGVSLLVCGEIHVQTDDYWGNRSIVTVMTAGDMFGQAYLSDGTIMNDVVAVKPSIVIFFDAKRLLSTCSSACRFHTAVIRNLFFTMSENNRRLMTKLSHMQKRTTREKLMSYLSLMSQKAGSASFTIPLNRSQLADYLSVDRSAMSNELCKMRDEGLIEFEKNAFVLK